MIKTIYICDKCKKQKTVKDNMSSQKEYDLLSSWGWSSEYVAEDNKCKHKHYCSKKCKPRRKPEPRVSCNDDSDPGVGSLYGRT